MPATGLEYRENSSERTGDSAGDEDRKLEPAMFLDHFVFIRLKFGSSEFQVVTGAVGIKGLRLGGKEKAGGSHFAGLGKVILNNPRAGGGKRCQVGLADRVRREQGVRNRI